MNYTNLCTKVSRQTFAYSIIPENYSSVPIQGDGRLLFFGKFSPSPRSLLRSPFINYRFFGTINGVNNKQLEYAELPLGGEKYFI